MTKKQDVWDRVDTYTKTASDNVRTYALAGLGIVWLFTGLSNGKLTDIEAVPTLFVWSAGFFGGALVLDVPSLCGWRVRLPTLAPPTRSTFQG